MERLMEWQALQQLRQEHQESGQGRGENVQALRSWLFEEVTVSNMIRYMFAVTLGLISVAIPLRAANRPHAGTDRQNKMVWTKDRKSTRLNSSHQIISYAVFCLKKKKTNELLQRQ